ncbi:71dce450-6ead-4434-ad51-da94d38dd91e [Sclerotinia trifoliorum]|uniref:71dce450-6ead-4434-ad51-da94d38dd91e n=1 Tax=Sclerotinia trifoliorum TaxID=28548 RepID=A0A8H2ZNF8_9HELO|nr:71dce450-6ead-4434-ad51-da94d38dd91e [Sclerotinia trifoliorum]
MLPTKECRLQPRDELLEPNVIQSSHLKNTHFYISLPSQLIHIVHSNKAIVKMPSAVINTTIQSCILSGASNIIAQFISAHQNNTAFRIDWTPVFHFILYTAVSAPPNFYLQSLLENLLPSKKQPATQNVSEKSPSSSSPQPVPSLSLTNTILKVILDQTLFAVLNVMLFLITFSLLRGSSLSQAIQSSKEEYWDMMKAGWKLWPFVSLSNFAVIKSVQGRALLGSLAGIGWNVYLGLVQGGK